MLPYVSSPVMQFFDPTTGLPLVGGKLYTYVNQTTTPVTTYPTPLDAQNLTNPNANPIILDANGSCTVVVTELSTFKLTTPTGSTIWTLDGIGNTSVTGDILDINGNVILRFIPTTDAVNFLTMSNNVLNSGPTIGVDGLDANINLNITGKGSGNINLNNSLVVSDVINSTAYFTATGDPSGAGPVLGVGGTGADINMYIQGKGLGGVIFPKVIAAADTVTGGVSGNPPTGYIGELVTTSGNTGSLGSSFFNPSIAIDLHLSAGEWDAIGVVSTVPNPATNIYSFGIQITTVNGGTLGQFASQVYTYPAILTTGGVIGLVTEQTFNFTQPTTIHLQIYSIFNVSTMSANYTFSARRVA